MTKLIKELNSCDEDLSKIRRYKCVDNLKIDDIKHKIQIHEHNTIAGWASVFSATGVFVFVVFVGLENF